MKFTAATCCLSVIVFSASAYAADATVEQKNKQFSVTSLSVKAGDTIDFKNTDPFHHNIFSLSETKTFDLGSFAEGESRSVTMDRPGTVEVECAIHPNMLMTVKVE
jgi:plastocyanin